MELWGLIYDATKFRNHQYCHQTYRNVSCLIPAEVLHFRCGPDENFSTLRSEEGRRREEKFADLNNSRVFHELPINNFRIFLGFPSFFSAKKLVSDGEKSFCRSEWRESSADFCVFLCLPRGGWKAKSRLVDFYSDNEVRLKPG